MKRLILCCDGTWNRADQEHDGAPCPTNVVKVEFRVAKRAASVPHIVYCDQGVGTGNALDRFSGGALGGMAKDPEKPGDESWVEDPTQSVHESVRARWEKDPAYRPTPLKAYFERS
jgi:hypothetical protein